jgi:hypothetical protein
MAIAAELHVVREIERVRERDLADHHTGFVELDELALGSDVDRALGADRERAVLFAREREDLVLFPAEVGPFERTSCSKFPLSTNRSPRGPNAKSRRSEEPRLSTWTGFPSTSSAWTTPPVVT